MLINRDEKAREGSGENFVMISNLFWRPKADFSRGELYSDKSIFVSGKSPVMKPQNSMIFRNLILISKFNSCWNQCNVPKSLKELDLC